MFSTEDKLKVLKEYESKLWDNVYAYSDNMLMTTPRPGYESKWKEEQHKALCLDEIIKAIRLEANYEK